MRRTTFLALGATLGILGSAFTGLSSPLSAMAARPAPASAAGLDGFGSDFTPAVQPGALDPNRKVTMMLEMTGNPVAVVKSLAPGKTLSDSEKGQVETDLQGKQDSIKPSIEGNGAQVVGQYQNAYNGIKVVAPASSVGSLAALPGVVAVHPVTVHTLDNSVSVPYIGAPATWTSTGFHGENIKVAIVDTGIDYTHANFGGPGTAAAYQAALATDTQPANPALFGPNAPKVKGGIDLVGDNYDAAAPAGSPKLIPHPDPNPLDCAGHGSHVAGTTAGFGVKADGTTYAGPYDSSIYAPNHFTIGPGVAPKADLYAVRVFGCTGSTNVVTDALDWAVKNGMQVVNMSLGSSYGNPADPDVTATNNAVAAGVVVVASAGNSGPNPYIVGSPSIAAGAISVAATDSTPTFPGAVLHITKADNTTADITAIDANGATIPSGSYPVTVLRDTSGFSLGCNEADYTNPAQPVAGHIVVTRRGTCARILRAQLGAKHGAIAVVMTNNAAGLPPYEGPIDGVPSTMPFLGVDFKDRAVMRSAVRASMTAVALPNPTYRQIIGFSSSGPRRIDSAFKPDITAPGVAIFSTGMGTGNQGTYLSGTSMAAPHVTGVAALTIQAHPDWDIKDLRAAIVNTGDPGKVAGYVSNAAGTGLVQPSSAVHTSVTVEHSLVPGNPGDAGGNGSNGNSGNTHTGATVATNVSFGFSELSRDFHEVQSFNVLNHGGDDATFAVSVEQAATAAGSSPHTATVNRHSVTVGGGDHATINLTLDVPAATAGNTDTFRDVRGMVVLTPIGGSNAGVTLRLPYYMVPRPRSTVASALSSGFSHTSPTGTVSITNARGVIPGTADFYAWGLSGDHSQLGEIGLRAVGVQSFDYPGLGKVGAFAVNTFSRWSAPNVDEFDILIDSTPDHSGPNYLVVGMDNGLLTTGSFDGTMVTAVINLATGRDKINFLASGPTDGSTIELTFLYKDIGVTASNPRFTYTAQSFDDRGDLGGASDSISGTAGFNAFTSAISNGDFQTVAPGATVASAASINPAEWARTPAKGLMVVSLDNHSGGSQAQLIPVS